jgi:hypothetical protein
MRRLLFRCKYKTTLNVINYHLKFFLRHKVTQNMHDLRSITLKLPVKFFKYPSSKGCDTLSCRLIIFSRKVTRSGPRNMPSFKVSSTKNMGRNHFCRKRYNSVWVLGYITANGIVTSCAETQVSGATSPANVTKRDVPFSPVLCTYGI